MEEPSGTNMEGRAEEAKEGEKKAPERWPQREMYCRHIRMQRTARWFGEQRSNSGCPSCWLSQQIPLDLEAVHAQMRDREKEKKNLSKQMAQLNAEIEDLGAYYKEIRQEQKDLREVVFTLADEQDDWEAQQAELPAPERTKRNVFDEYVHAQREHAKPIPRPSEGDLSAPKSE